MQQKRDEAGHTESMPSDSKCVVQPQMPDGHDIIAHRHCSEPETKSD